MSGLVTPVALHTHSTASPPPAHGRAAWKEARRARAEYACFNITVRGRQAQCGDTLLAITKSWLAEPSSLNRPTFETCLETGALHHPSTAVLKAARLQAEQARCRRVNELSADKRWIALDCEDYGHPPRRADGNRTVYHRQTPLSLCAPPHVSVACLSCSSAHLRPGLDLGVPPITPRLKSFSRLKPLPRDNASVGWRCHAHANDTYRLAASFRGSTKHATTIKRVLRTRLSQSLHGKAVSPALGPLSIRLTDTGSQGAPVINSSSMDVDLQHSQFGLCPRGDS